MVKKKGLIYQENKQENLLLKNDMIRYLQRNGVQKEEKQEQKRK